MEDDIHHEGHEEGKRECYFISAFVPFVSFVVR